MIYNCKTKDYSAIRCDTARTLQKNPAFEIVVVAKKNTYRQAEITAHEANIAGKPPIEYNVRVNNG